jgi:hypothetical protein
MKSQQPYKSRLFVSAAGNCRHAKGGIAVIRLPQIQGVVLFLEAQ